MDNQITKYVASDGSEVELTAQSVLQYVATGNAQPQPREVARFIALCQARKLNPMTGDCYLTVFNGREGPQASVIVSKDYFVRTAAQQPTFDGLEAGIIVISKGQPVERQGSTLLPGEQLVGGWAKVYDKNRSHPTYESVSFSEYNTGKKMWQSKPATMIRKVALVQALREAYPLAYAGLYDSSEMPEPQQAAIPAPAPDQAMDERKAWMAEMVPELATAEGTSEEEARRALWGMGHYTEMDDGAWSAYQAAVISRIEKASENEAVEPSEVEVA